SAGALAAARAALRARPARLRRLRGLHRPARALTRLDGAVLAVAEARPVVGARAGAAGGDGHDLAGRPHRGAKGRGVSTLAARVDSCFTRRRATGVRLRRAAP